MKQLLDWKIYSKNKILYYNSWLEANKIFPVLDTRMEIEKKPPKTHKIISAM